MDLIVRLRKEPSDQGLDAGPETITWHLVHDHDTTVSRATVARHLSARGLVTPEPKKRPKSSYIRFEASTPNERWQSTDPCRSEPPRHHLHQPTQGHPREPHRRHP